MKTGVELIAEERQRQMDVEGWTPEHDDKHQRDEMNIAARCYATSAEACHYSKNNVTFNTYRQGGTSTTSMAMGCRMVETDR